MLVVTKKLKEWLINNGHVGGSDPTDEACRNQVSNLVTSGRMTGDQLKTLTEDHREHTKGLIKEAIGEMQPTVTPSHSSAAVFGGPGRVDVKDPSGHYSITKSVGVNKWTGQPVKGTKGLVETPSDYEFAKAGVLFKWQAKKAGLAVQFNDHENAIFLKMLAEERWVGKINNQEGIHTGLTVKALLGDSLSGGGDLVPEFFDAAVIQFPLLHSEIFPYVDRVEVPIGKSIETGSIENPTVEWGTEEGTATSLFDTDGMVNPITADIHSCQVSIEVGRDLMADSPADIGRRVLENMGQAMLKDFDRVICVGNGTTEPQGLFSASGTNAVTADNAGSGPPTVDDYLSLVFAVGKQYRAASLSPAFIANDTSYARARGIMVNSSSDQRLVFGMDVENYNHFGRPFRICNDIPNTKMAFGALNKYRLWMRQGIVTTIITNTPELVRASKVFMHIKTRLGGKVVDANAFSVITNGMS